MLLLLVGAVMLGATIGWLLLRIKRVAPLEVGDCVKLAVELGGRAHDMVGEVTSIRSTSQLNVWVRWENDARCNYSRHELEKVDAARPGEWLGDCGEPACNGRHTVQHVERHGGKRCVAFMCGESRVRQSERRFLERFKRVG